MNQKYFPKIKHLPKQPEGPNSQEFIQTEFAKVYKVPPNATTKLSDFVLRGLAFSTGKTKMLSDLVAIYCIC